MKTPKILVVVMVLQALALLTLWTGRDVLPVAQGQVIDSGGQRMEQIAQQKLTNEKLDRLIALLESGDLQVKVVASDEDDKAAAETKR
jgi:hypothetical protein